VCVCLCVCACVSVCESVCVCACVHASVCVCVHMYCIYAQVDGVFPSTTRTLQDAASMTIARLVKEDQGTYECTAENVVARAITQTLLLIESMCGAHSLFSLIHL